MRAMNEKKRDHNIFHFLLLIVCVIMIVFSFNYNPTARAFPLFFGILCFLLVSLQLIVDNVKKLPKFLSLFSTGTMTELPSRQTAEAAETDQAEAKKALVPWKTIFLIFACLALYLVLMNYIHYLLASLLVMIFFMRFFGQVKWSTTIIYSVIFIGCLFGLFELILSH